MQTKGIIIGKIPHCVSHRIHPKNAVRINPSGEVELVNEETADKRMGKWGIAKPIHGVWAYVLYDRRFVVDVDNESYSLAPVYIFSNILIISSLILSVISIFFDGSIFKIMSAGI